MAKTKMSDWTTMIGDVCWEDHGGSWGHKLRDGVWLVLRFENKSDWGDGAKGYYCDVLQVDLNTLPEDELKSALQCCGFEFDQEGNVLNEHDGETISERGSEHYEIVLVECCMSYGCYAPLDSTEGDSYPLRVRAEARRIADSYFEDQYALNERLNRPVNAIGSTALEFGRGDIQSAMDRAREPVTVKRIKRRDLTAECWLIQMHGTKACDHCDVRDTPDCGGQEIRKTGENEKGIEIGKAGL